MGSFIFFPYIFLSCTIFLSKQKSQKIKCFKQSVQSQCIRSPHRLSIPVQGSAASSGTLTIGREAKWDKDDEQIPKSTKTSIGMQDWAPAQPYRTGIQHSGNPGLDMQLQLQQS